MRKSRIFFIVLTLVLITLLIGSWYMKEPAISRIINLLYGQAVIQNISGLELGFGEISARQIRLQPARGKMFILDKVTISHPFHIVLNRKSSERVEISVGKLSLHTGGWTGPINTLNTADKKHAYPVIDLSQALQSIIYFMPGKVFINQIVLDNNDLMGPLDITRHNRHISAKLPYTSSQHESYNLSLKADITPAKIQLNASIDSNIRKAVSYADVTIVKNIHGGWLLDTNAVLTMDSLSPFVDIATGSATGLSPKIHTTGAIAIRTTSDIPDNITAISGYRNITFSFESENLTASFQSKLLDTVLKAQLSTTTPIEIKLSGLDRLIPEYITGAGRLILFPAGNLPERNFLLDSEFESHIQTNISRILVNGSVNLASGKILANSPIWNTIPALTSIKNQNGTLNFYGEINLQPLDQLSSTEKKVFDSFTLTLTPESQVHITAHMQNSTEGSLLQPFGFDKSRVQVGVEDNLTITGAISQSGRIHLVVSGGTVSVKMQGEKSRNSILAHFRKIRCNINDNTECTFGIESEVPEIVNPISGISITQLFSDSNVRIQKTGDKYWLQIKAFTVTAKEIKDKSLHLKNSEFRMPGLHCVFHAHTSSCNSTKGESNVTATVNESLSFSGDVSFGNLKLQIEDGKTDFSGTYNSNNLHLTASGNYALDASLSGFVALTGNVLEGKGNLVSGPLVIQHHLQHSLKQAKGRILFSLPPVVFSPMQPLSQTVKGLPIDVVSGQVSASGTLSWPQQQGSALRLTLSDIATVYADSFATGIDAKLLFEKDSGQWVTGEPQSLSIQSMDAGLPLEKIRFSLFLDRDMDLVLRDFAAEFLGGKVTSQALTWNLSQVKRQSTLYAQDISLEELARVTESKHFEAKGRLNLTIPMITGPDGITVEKGHVRALAPGGQLRYYGAFSPQMLADNPQLNLIANALEDYLFHTLEGNMEYSPSGDLLLKLQLVGRSDSVDIDRDLIINLNLENNIPAMLHSLQASRDVAEALEKQLDQ
ncbi:intermembrane phospholipid transport protein YdbH family protein [Microbulbifer spongiae]|uniref:YdbH domain-containing protein n=1 Tax=Microbulbifer spongiae TaxID=2944933 RepID=A0ABY9EF92_9GAMM|nr:YdbH domain-containing protein [Microbulbifer sp. MI-G]WKD50671.1 YdbH domain-containing protein [Microbulbifer sp. MI-G]